MGCHFLLQEIFQTQGSNRGFPRCRQTLYRLSHQGLEAEKSKEANASLELPKKTVALLMLFKPSETRVGLLAYLEKNKDNLHLTLQGEIWTFIHRPNADIQTKHPRSTGEGQTAGDLWKGFGKGK